MSIEWFLYLAEICQSLKVLFLVSGLLGLIIFLFTCLPVGVEGLFSEFINNSLVRKIIFILPILLFLACIIPSQKTMYLIAGVHIAKNSEVSQKVLEVINKKLDEYLVEEKKEK